MVWKSSKSSSKPPTEYPVEYLLDNKLDEDFIAMFYPLHLVQNIFFTPKYEIRDRFVTPKSVRFYALYVAAVLGAVLAAVLRLLHELTDFGIELHDAASVYVAVVFFFMFNACGCVALAAAHVAQRHSSVAFLLTLQRAHRRLCPGRLPGTAAGSWLAAGAGVAVNLLMYFFYYYIQRHFDVLDMILDAVFITFDVNMIYSIRTIILLRRYVDVWIERVATSGDEQSAQLGATYEDLLAAYSLYCDMHHVLILIHTADCFFRPLCYIHMLIQTLRQPTRPASDAAWSLSGVVVVWLGKDALLQALQCAQAERFLLATERAAAAALQPLRRRHCAESRSALFWRVLSLNKVRARALEAAGLFRVDAALLLLLLDYITNYVVVLLQFTFL